MKRGLRTSTKVSSGFRQDTSVKHSDPRHTPYTSCLDLINLTLRTPMTPLRRSPIKSNTPKPKSLRINAAAAWLSRAKQTWVAMARTQVYQRAANLEDVVHPRRRLLRGSRSHDYSRSATRQNKGRARVGVCSSDE